MRKAMYSLAVLLGLIIFLSFCHSITSTASAAANSGSDDWAMYRRVSVHTGYDENSFSADSASLLWTFRATWEISSSPAVVDGCVYVGSWDCFVYCLNASSGQEIWNSTTCGSVWTSPAIENGRVYVGSDDGWLWCMNSTTGVVLWYSRIGSPVRSSPVIAEGFVYVGSGEQGLFCLNATDGKTIWFSPTSKRVNSSPAVSNGVVYFACDDYAVHAVNASSGNEIWQHHTGSVESSPSIWNGCVYDGSADGYVYCLNASTGDHVWTFQTEDSVCSSPAIAYGCVYVGSDDGYVYCLDAISGQKNWRSQTEYWVHSSPAIGGGCVYVGSQDNNIYCFNASTGAKEWSYPTWNYVDSSPAIVKNTLYVSSLDCNVYAFSLNNSTGQSPSWISTFPTSPNTIAFDAVAIIVATIIISTIFLYARSASRAKKVVSPEKKASWFSAHVDAFCLLAIVAFSAIFFINLSRGVLWAADERTYSQWAFHMTKSGDYLTPWGFGMTAVWLGKPQLFMWLMSLSYQLLGFSDFSSRIWSPIFGLLSLVFVFFLGKKLYNSTVGLLAALILGTFTTFYVFARHAMTDIPLIFFMLGSIYFMILSDKEEHSSRYAVLSGLFFGLALLTKQMAALFIPIILIIYFAATKRSIKFLVRKNIAYFVGFALLIFVPWLVYMGASFGSDFWYNYFIYNNVTRAVSPVEGHIGDYLYYFYGLVNRENFVWVTILPFALGLVVFNSVVKRSKADTLVITWAAIVLLVFTLAQTKMFYYILPVYPAFALAIGNLLYTASKKLLLKTGSERKL